MHLWSVVGMGVSNKQKVLGKKKHSQHVAFYGMHTNKSYVLFKSNVTHKTIHMTEMEDSQAGLQQAYIHTTQIFLAEFYLFWKLTKAISLNLVQTQLAYPAHE